ncbi:hypothetical protein [Vibrio crassostreae]|uniref:hypothetical protein n=1 Tax=Vibrio crassostreae TaxID=246167 RepID=UPI001B306179|nr:hypothetical protein [Vibrio crassostreae]
MHYFLKALVGESKLPVTDGTTILTFGDIEQAKTWVSENQKHNPQVEFAYCPITNDKYNELLEERVERGKLRHKAFMETRSLIQSIAHSSRDAKDLAASNYSAILSKQQYDVAQALDEVVGALGTNEEYKERIQGIKEAVANYQKLVEEETGVWEEIKRLKFLIETVAQ